MFAVTELYISELYIYISYAPAATAGVWQSHRPTGTIECVLSDREVLSFDDSALGTVRELQVTWYELVTSPTLTRLAENNASNAATTVRDHDTEFTSWRRHK